jgi:hypothetical protein
MSAEHKESTSGLPDGANAPEGRAESPVERTATRGVVLSNPRIIAGPREMLSTQLGFQDAFAPELLDLGTAFEYLPLQEGRFRLLEIATAGVYPWCTLEEYDLDNAPPYAALSYAWGLPITTRSMFCQNPGSNMASFSISEHVLEALNRLFGFVPKRHKIWIDAICIDQGNPTEKAHQIAAMPRIYSQAHEVLCWLGAEENKSDLVMQKLPSMAEWQRQHFADPMVGLDLKRSQVPIEPPDQELWGCMMAFFLRPWFRRLWVVQEILMARELVLVCGGRAISWDSLVAAAGEFSSLRIEVDDIRIGRLCQCAMKGINELGMWREAARGAVLNGLSQPEFVRILLWGCQRQVTEPVDRIWALTGLARPELRKSVAPLVDYSSEGRSNFYATFKNFVQAFLLQDERLWMLSLAAVTPKHGNLPSWCPNFSYCSEDRQLGLLQRDFKHYNAGYSAAEPLKPNVRFSPGNGHLVVRGFFTDKIQSGRVLGTPEDSELRFRFDNRCLEHAAELYKDRAKAVEAHCRTLIADRRIYVRDPEKGHEVSIPELIEIYATWRMHLEGDPDLASLNPEERHAISWFNDRARVSTQRGYIGTAGGRLGLAPIETKVGDLICILYGASTPYVVRPNGDGNSMTLVGDAYIHGLMDGEALSMPERQLECDIVIS